MYTDTVTFKKNLNYLADVNGYKVLGRHHPTTGSFFLDVIRCMRELYWRKCPHTVEEIHKDWDNLFENLAPHQKIILYLYSEGNIVGHNALATYDPEKWNCFTIIGICPGGYIYPKLCHDYAYICNARDFVHNFDVLGTKRCENSSIFCKPQLFKLFEHDLQSQTIRPELKALSEAALTGSGFGTFFGSAR